MVSFALDALGRTASRTEGADVTTFSYAGEGREPARVVVAPSGGPEQETLLSHSPSGPLAQGRGEEVHVLLSDLHTDVVGLASPGGDASGSVSYSPWGEVRSQTGASTPLGFQGDVADPATGLVDMGARLYAPSMGRFTTPDPLFGDPTRPISLNQYLYGVAAPVTHHDPSGMCPPQYCVDPGYHGKGHTRASKLKPLPSSWAAPTPAAPYTGPSDSRARQTYAPPRPKAHAPNVSFNVGKIAVADPKIEATRSHSPLAAVESTLRDPKDGQLRSENVRWKKNLKWRLAPDLAAAADNALLFGPACAAYAYAPAYGKLVCGGAAASVIAPLMQFEAVPHKKCMDGFVAYYTVPVYGPDRRLVGIEVTHEETRGQPLIYYEQVFPGSC